jgi:hypothetical protein
LKSSAGEADRFLLMKWSEEFWEDADLSRALPLRPSLLMRDSWIALVCRLPSWKD